MGLWRWRALCIIHSETSLNFWGSLIDTLNRPRIALLRQRNWTKKPCLSMNCTERIRCPASISWDKEIIAMKKVPLCVINQEIWLKEYKRQSTIPKRSISRRPTWLHTTSPNSETRIRTFGKLRTGSLLRIQVKIRCFRASRKDLLYQVRIRM